MKVITDKNILADPSLNEAVESATRILEEEIGNPASRITAEWNLLMDNAKSSGVELRISDYTGEATGQLALDELRPSSHLRNRLYSLWGDLLQSRSHKLLEQLRQHVQELERA